MEKNNEETSNLGLDISILDVVDKEDITLVKRLIKENIKCENCEKVSCYCYISYSLALAKAVALDNQEIINLLLDATEKVDKKTVTKELLYLFHIESFKSVKILLNKVGIKNIDINAQDESNEHKTLLIYAVLYEQQELVQILIEAGADVNLKNIYGRAPLMWAAYQGNVDIVKMLIDKNADVNVLEEYYRPYVYDPPFEMDYISGHSEPISHETWERSILHAMLNKKYDTKEKEEKRMEIIELLKNAGAKDIDRKK